MPDEPTLKQAVVARALGLAEAHGRAGRRREKEQVCRQLLAEVPDCAEAWSMLAILMVERNNGLQAQACMERAITIAPGEPSFHANLGELMRRAGMPDRALVHCMRAVELGPDHRVARLNLGYALLDSGRAAESHGHFDYVAARESGNVQAWSGLGHALLALGQMEAAATVLARCAALVSNDADIRIALARSRLGLDDFQGALADAKNAVALQPRSVEANNILADVLMNDGRIADAEVALRGALQVLPGYAPLRYRLALCRLAQGDYREGFALYEARFGMDVANRIEPPLLPMPMWAGEDLRGRRLLVLTEQGYGDHLQFCRFISRLAANGVSVVLGASPPMRDLMLTLPGCAQVLTQRHEAQTSGCDFWTFVGSLPYRLGIDTGGVVPAGAYLAANPVKRAAWRERLARFATRRRIGLVWAGRPDHENDQRRSLPFASLAPLSGVPDVTWISLQGGPRATDANLHGDALRVERIAEESASFDDSAALIAELDLLISVDTAPAHLAGALGCPVWTLLPAVADWRWSLDDKASPWYPGMRLFRQASRGDWDGVIREVASALAGNSRL